MGSATPLSLAQPCPRDRPVSHVLRASVIVAQPCCGHTCTQHFPGANPLSSPEELRMSLCERACADSVRTQHHLSQRRGLLVQSTWTLKALSLPHCCCRAGNSASLHCPCTPVSSHPAEPFEFSPSVDKPRTREATCPSSCDQRLGFILYWACP